MAETATRRRWFRREREDRSLTKQSSGFPSIYFPSTAGGANVRDATRSPAVQACVIALTQAAARHTLRLYADGVEVGGPTADLLRRPRPGITQATFVSQLVRDLLLRQEAFVGKRRSGGELFSLEVLDPDRLGVDRIADEPRFAYTEANGKVEKNLTLDDVIPILGITVDGMRGVSPIQENREIIALSRKVIEYASEFWSSGGIPIGVLRLPSGTQADEQARNLAAALKERQSGADRARLAVMSGEVTFEGISGAARDAGWEEAHRAITADVARTLGLFPAAVNAEQQGGSLTYTNVQSQLAMTVQWALGSSFVLIEQSISADEDLCPGPLEVRFTPDPRLTQGVAPDE
jgi:HK97 family phage portal protein